MKKGLTELIFILDRSGSMSGLEALSQAVQAVGAPLSVGWKEHIDQDFKKRKR